jgi:hypothetical protein
VSPAIGEVCLRRLHLGRINHRTEDRCRHRADNLHELGYRIGTKEEGIERGVRRT